MNNTWEESKKSLSDKISRVLGLIPDDLPPDKHVARMRHIVPVLDSLLASIQAQEDDLREKVAVQDDLLAGIQAREDGLREKATVQDEQDARTQSLQEDVARERELASQTFKELDAALSKVKDISSGVADLWSGLEARQNSSGEAMATLTSSLKDILQSLGRERTLAEETKAARSKAVEEKESTLERWEVDLTQRMAALELRERDAKRDSEAAARDREARSTMERQEQALGEMVDRMSTALSGCVESQTQLREADGSFRKRQSELIRSQAALEQARIELSNAVAANDRNVHEVNADLQLIPGLKQQAKDARRLAEERSRSIARLEVSNQAAQEALAGSEDRLRAVTSELEEVKDRANRSAGMESVLAAQETLVSSLTQVVRETSRENATQLLGLQQELEKLAGDGRAKDQAISRLTEACEELKAGKRALIDSGSAKNRKLLELGQQRGRVTEEKRALVEDGKAKDLRNLQLKEQLSTLEADKKALTDDAKTRDQEVAHLTARCDKLEGEKTVLAGDGRAKDQKFSQLETRWQTLDEEKRALTESGSAKESEISHLKALQKECRESVDKLTLEKKGLTEQRSAGRRRISELQDQYSTDLAALERESNGLFEQVCASTHQISELKKQCCDEVDILEYDNAQLLGRLCASNRQISDLEERHADDMGSLESINDGLFEQVATSDKKIAGLQEQLAESLDALEHESGQLTRQISARDDEIAGLRNQYTEALLGIDREKERSKAEGLQIQELHERGLEKLRLELDERHRREMDTLRTSLTSEAERGLEKLRLELDERHRREMDTLRASLTSEAERGLEKLRLELDERHRREMDTLRASLTSEAERGLEKLRLELDERHRRDMDTLRANLTSEAEKALEEKVSYCVSQKEREIQRQLGDVAGQNKYLSNLKMNQARQIADLEERLSRQVEPPTPPSLSRPPRPADSEGAAWHDALDKGWDVLTSFVPMIVGEKPRLDHLLHLTASALSSERNAQHFARFLSEGNLGDWYCFHTILTKGHLHEAARPRGVCHFNGEHEKKCLRMCLMDEEIVPRIKVGLASPTMTWN